MRRFTTAQLAPRLQLSASLRPTHLSYLAQRETFGDPGPSTARRYQSSFSGDRKDRSWKARSKNFGIRPSTDKGGYQRVTQLEDTSAQPAAPTSGRFVTDRKTGRVTTNFARGGTFTRSDVVTRAPKDSDRLPKSHARRSAPAYFESERPFVKPKLHFGLTKSEVQPSHVSSSYPKWKLDPMIHGRPLTPREMSFRVEKTEEEMQADKTQRKTTRNKFQQLDRSERPTGHQGDAYETSARVTEWIAKHKRPTDGEIESLINLLTTAGRQRVNAVVWNQVLAFLGRQGKMERMWKAYQDVSRHSRA